jgi:hypothetical protein
LAEAGPTPKQIEFLRKETSGILRDLFISTSNEVWKFCDHAHVKEIANNLINEDLGVLFPAERLINKGIASVVEIIQLGAAINCNPENIEVEIREKGAIETIHDCFYKNASPEFCIYASHLGSERLCQLADPELECLWTHHLTNGDPFCRCIIKKKSIPYKEPESLGNIVLRLPRVNLSDEQVFQMRMHDLVTGWINNTLIFKILQGNEKTIEVLCSNSKIIGRIFGFSLLEASILPVRNIAAMGYIISQDRKSVV